MSTVCSLLSVLVAATQRGSVCSFCSRSVNSINGGSAAKEAELPQSEMGLAALDVCSDFRYKECVAYCDANPDYDGFAVSCCAPPHVPDMYPHATAFAQLVFVVSGSP